ncbi:MAG TPA: SH3 domain-containing protein [Bauldia sp.]|nr:SH3 domain-containing protein [Bauldia sp.]
MTRSMLLAAVAAIVAAAPAHAEFFGWQVANVASWDVLNVRTAPTSGAGILVGYPNATPLSLTGKCTGGLNLNTINGWPKAKQAAAVRYRWCEAWIDPTGSGNWRSGWVYGRFIAPL